MVTRVPVPAEVANGDYLRTIADTAEPSNLFPSRVALTALRSYPRAVDAIAARAVDGHPARPIEIVQVPKLDRTTRPAADMSIEDSLVFEAMSRSVADRVEPGFVVFTGEGNDQQPYRDFEAFPLSVDGCRYVIEADAAAFYQYVDHDQLEYELLGLTGWSEGPQALVSLLGHWMGAARGLPQGPPASGSLADIYISRASRALTRAGFSHSRYNDDFRIPVASWRQGREALAMLERALASVGLVLAAGKLRTPRLETYRDQLRQVHEGRGTTGALSAALAELDAPAPYTADMPGAAAEPRRELAPHEVAQSERVITDQLQLPKVDVVGTRLIRRALNRLATASSPGALSHVGALLSKYPHLTPTVSGYLRSLMGTDTEGVAIQSAIEWTASDAYQFPWQIGWIAHALASSRSQDNGNLANWSNSHLFADDVPWFARGQLAAVAARQNSLPPINRFVDIYERSSPAAQPDFVAAAVIGTSRWRDQFLDGVSDTPLLEGVRRLSRDAAASSI